MDRIPVAAPYLGGNEEKYVVDAIQSTWISSTGKYIQQFEETFAQLCETNTAISVVNGTAALHLALLGLDVQPGDEVLVPSLTYIATANAVRYMNAEPVFVDVDPVTWCIDPCLLEEKITERTKGIIAVHLYGHPADMDAINQVAKKYGLWVIEDAAEAHFARYKGRRVGSLATMATFSFYGNKIVTSGEGGAITLNDPNLEPRIRMFRGQGMDPNRRYYFPITGYNYRLTNIACAILCAQLERYKSILTERRKIFDTYNRFLRDVPGIGLQSVATWAEAVPWLYCITVDPTEYGYTRDELIVLLDQAGIETRPFFISLHQLPPFKEKSRQRNDYLPITEKLSKNGLNLPTFSGLTENQIATIVSVITSPLRTS